MDREDQADCEGSAVRMLSSTVGNKPALIAGGLVTKGLQILFQFDLLII